MVDGTRARLTGAALARIGDEAVVLYDGLGTEGHGILMAVVGEDKLPRVILTGCDRILKQLGGKKRIYADSLAARLTEQEQQLPIASNFEDLHIATSLLDAAGLPDADGITGSSQRTTASTGSTEVVAEENDESAKLAAAASQIRQRWDEGRPLERLREQGLEFVYEHIEKPIVAPTAAMIENGILVDWTKLKRLSKRHQRDLERHQRDLERHQREVDQLAGKHLKWQSPQDLANTLFEDLGLIPCLVNPDASPRTTSEALLPLVDSHPIVKHVLRLRELEGLLTSASNLLGMCAVDSERIHCRIDPLGTVTGRFACTNPSLQSVPAELREVFVAEPGHLLLAPDFSQFELRVLAEMTGSPALFQAFRNGIDVHRLTAAQLFGVNPAPGLVGAARIRQAGQLFDHFRRGTAEVVGAAQNRC